MQNVFLMSERAAFGILQIPGNLLHPFFGRVSGHAGKDDSSRLQLNHEQNVIGDQTSPSQHLDGKEVHPGQNRHMRSDEFLPARCPTTVRSRRNPMPSENVADRLIRDFVA